MSDDLFRGYGVEVRLKDPDAFLKTKETLTRIGVASNKEGAPKLYQSCHILHKRGRYAIVHFKELFALDGKATTLTEEDVLRRNKITNLLAEWGLVELVDKAKTKEEAPIAHIKVIPFKEKGKWELVPKYNIGGKKADTRVLLLEGDNHDQ